MHLDIGHRMSNFFESLRHGILKVPNSLAQFLMVVVKPLFAGGFRDDLCFFAGFFGDG